MHLVLHIFKKDVRRLWWGIAIALALQTAAACFWAIDKPDSLQLSLLLIATWACLIALAVHEDPLVGDRQFWISRPAQWRTLLASKLLFAVAVVHLPAFVSDIAVLAARGFRPWEWLGSLLTKQLLMAMALTLPVIALAALLSSFSYLALAAIAIGGLTALAGNFTPTLYSRWRGVEDTRMVLFCAILGVAAAAIVPRQFARRKIWPSRLIGVMAVGIAEMTVAFLSPIFLARVRAAAYSTHASIAFHLSPHPESADNAIRIYPNSDQYAAVKLPLNASGIPANLASLYDLPVFDLLTPDGRRYQVGISYVGPKWLVLVMGRTLYESLQNVKVEVRGAAPMIFFRPGPTESIPVGANRVAPGVGRCSSAIIELPRSNLGLANTDVERRRFLRVVCESPGGFPLPAFIKLVRPGEGTRDMELRWPSGLRLLAPIERAEGDFPLGPAEDPTIGKLEITGDIPAGWKVVDLDLPDIRLADYVAR